MNIAEYVVIPEWVFHCYSVYVNYRDHLNSYHSDNYDDPRHDLHSYREFRGFFAYRSNVRVYIIEKPEGRDVKSFDLHCDQEEARHAINELGKEFRFRIIDSDCEDGRKFYRERARARAREFDSSINPFIPVFAQLGL